MQSLINNHIAILNSDATNDHKQRNTHVFAKGVRQ